MGKLEKSFYGLGFVVALYLIVGFTLIPIVLKNQLIKNLDENLSQKTNIEKIEFNPLTLNAKIHGFKLLDENDKSDISFNLLSIDFAVMRSIEKKHISFQNITLDGANINILQEKDGTINLTKLLKPSTEETKIEEEKAPSDIKFLISKIDLTNANINYTTTIKDEVYTLNLKDINYTIYDLGTYKNALSSNDLQLKLNENTEVSIGGAFKLEPFKIYGKITINDLRIKELLDYKKELFNFSLNETANANIILNYNVDMTNELDLKLSTELLEINNIDLKQKNKSLVTLGKIDIKTFSFDLLTQDIKLDNINIDSLNANAIMDKNGINLATLINTKKEENAEKIEKVEETTQTATKPWLVSLSNVTLNKSDFLLEDRVNNSLLKTKNTKVNLKNLKIVDSDITLNEIELSNPTLSYLDNTNKLNISTKNTNINLDDLSINKNIIDINNIGIKQDNLSFNNKKSNIVLNTNNTNILINKLNIDGSKISINSVDTKIPNINFEDTKSKLNVKVSNTNLDIKKFTLNNSDITVDSIDLAKTALNLSDKANNLEINAKDLNLNISKLSNTKSEFKIVKTNLNKPNISIVLAKANTLPKEMPQVTKIQPSKNNNKQSNNQTKLNIGPININNAIFSFEDKNLPIPFVTKVTSLNGKVSDIKNSNSSKTNLEVNGVVDKYGIAKITGIVDPNNIKILTDINMKFKNIAMQNFTPYTGKFIGRELKSGKLDLDLKYNIEKSNLDAKNNIVISKLELGKEVQSPDAVSLPLEIAISLLQNSKGVIDIDLPISGNVDDPQFAIGSILWKAFVNLMTKAVTAPFSLLGSLFNFSEDEIKSVKFDLTEDKITPIQKETLDKIAQILTAKKDLVIKISASYDKEKEEYALKEKKYLSKNSLDKNMKKEELEKVVSKQKVSLVELETIAKNRVSNIKNYLTKEKAINPKQITITNEIETSNASIDLKIDQLK